MMSRWLIALFSVWLFTSFFSTAWADTPQISDVMGTAIADGETVTIKGTFFGTKTAAAPLKFEDFENSAIGSPPSGWDAPLNTDSLVSDTMPYRGARSLDSSALNMSSDYFPRVSWDLGQTIPSSGFLYLSAWLYLDKNGTSATIWNWKGPIVTSENQRYYWGTPGHSATGFAGFYKEGRGWYNTATTISYSQDDENVYDYCTEKSGWASDAFHFDGWQRIEWIFKASSTPGTPDGHVVVNRVGKSGSPALDESGCITQGNTSGLWRYVSIPQGFTNIQEGTLNLRMFFDDVYMDSTVARVEIGNDAVFANCTHREIQMPSAWTADAIDVKVNTGSFSGNTDVYLFVIDEAGTPSQGYGPLKVGASLTGPTETPPTAAFTTAPSPPAGQAPLTVHFADTSTGAPTSWQWDFDGDGIIDDTEQTPVFIYTIAGEYTVSMTAANAVGEDRTTLTVSVSAGDTTPPDEGSDSEDNSGGSPGTTAGGGGGGGCFIDTALEALHIWNFYGINMCNNTQQDIEQVPNLRSMPISSPE